MWSRLYWFTVAIPLAVVLAIMALNPAPLVDLRNGLFDLYQRAAPRPFDPDLPVRIVDIDDASLARLGQWPWSRAVMAELVEKLAESGAAAIAFDMVFAEPDRLDPAAVVALLPQEVRPQVEAALDGRPDNDTLFAARLQPLPAVLGVVLSEEGAARTLPARWGIASAGDDPVGFAVAFSGAVAPLPGLTAAARGLGALNWLPDRDQVVRRVPLLLGLGGKLVPGLAAEALRVAQGASTYVVRASNASGEAAFGTRSGISAVKIGALDVPTDPAGEIRVRYGATDPRRFIPAHMVLDGTAPAAEIEGRIILVGTSAAGLKDARATPIDPAVPGVEIQAQAIEHMASGARLARPDWARGAEMLLTLVLGLGAMLVMPRVPAIVAGLGGLMVLGGLAAGSWFAFTRADLLLDPLGPAAGAGVVYLVGVLALYRQAQQQKRQVRQIFSRFVSPQVVERLAEHPERLALGGETRRLTVLFCDLRDFTTLSESMDAQALTRFMNGYLTPMTRVVLAHGGTIDKYIGDAIMAFWNAPMDDPDHARHAGLCALAMVAELKTLNARWQAEAAAAGRGFSPVRAGVGLATGDCCVGNLGSDQRLEYSALGDDVNLASRIEGATKALGADILVSQATRDAAPDLAFLEADVVLLKGKAKQSRLYLLAGDAAHAGAPAFRALAARHEAFRAALAGGDPAAALVLAERLAADGGPALEPYYKLQAAQCRSAAAIVTPAGAGS